MANYKVISRQFRPQRFADVRGQDAIVATLKNALKNDRLAHAYLFCGSRGTGKTTLARLLAKALNCESRNSDQEPCNSCGSCKEITSGSSLNVIEIDGASNRGIEDIRRINETVGYASASRFQIYIIDEVHMLTKEAFNALLKTLEEPPAQVKFFFATTEPQKVLPTIVSRCQRFNLSRISRQEIVTKLKAVALELGLTVEEGALQLVAQLADGGMRDAESLFDQLIAFTEGSVTEASVAAVLGLMPRERFFALDREGKQGNVAIAFEIAHQIFAEGKDLQHFAEALLEHFRNLAAVQVAGVEAPFLALSESEKQSYAISAKLYEREQVLALLDELIEAQQQMRLTPTKRIALEAILLKIVRSHQRVTLPQLVRKLSELEGRLGGAQAPVPALTPAPVSVVTAAVQVPKPVAPPAPPPKQPAPVAVSVSEDPTPRPEDLPRAKAKVVPTAAPTPAPTVVSKAAPTPAPKPTAPKPAAVPAPSATEQARRDTVMQFAAVELNGTLQKELS